MRFTIVIPVYRAEAYLPECIESVLRQSFTDFELILVDDGSPDNCPSICDEYASRDSRVRVIHQQNKGAVFARKAGLEAGTGDYVVIVDSDDYIEDSLLEKLSKIIDEFSPDIIKYNCKHFSDKFCYIQSNKFRNEYFNKDNIDIVLSSVMYDKTIDGLNFGGVLYSLWSGAVRRELLIQYQMPVPGNIRMGDDLAVTMPMICNCNSVYFADFVGYNYRCTEGSMVNSFNPNELKLLNGVIQYLSENIPETYRNSLSVYTLNMVLQYFSKAAKVYDRKQTEDFFRENLSDYIFQVAVAANVSKKGIKDGIKITLLKSKRYSALWYLMK